MSYEQFIQTSRKKSFILLNVKLIIYGMIKGNHFQIINKHPIFCCVVQIKIFCVKSKLLNLVIKLDIAMDVRLCFNL